MRCVLHIGTEKTATTTIQNFMYSNREALQQEGICLSDILGKNNNRKLATFCIKGIDEFLQDRGISTIVERNHFFDGFINEFKLEVEKQSSESDIFFITSELFHSRLISIESISRLKKLLDEVFSSVTIICYFREQSALVKSLYSTSVKVSNSSDFLSFVDKAKPTKHYYNYSVFFNKWKLVFGKDWVIPRLFITENFFEQDVRKDILHLIKSDITFNNFDFHLEDSNESLGLIGLELGRVVNRLLPRYNDDGSVNRLRGQLINLISRSELSNLGGLENQKAVNIYDDFSESNIAFAKEFFGFSGNPFPPPSSFKNETSPSPATNDLNITLFADPLVKFFEDLLFMFKGTMSFNDLDADFFRDTALYIAQNDKMSLLKAKTLMEYAHQIRPNGSFIKEKLDEYEKSLSTEPK